MTEKMVQTNGVELCTEAFGDANDPCIVLVMGAGASMLRWDDDFCRELAAGGRYVIRFDNRDVGRSTSYDPGTATYHAGDLADDAVGVIDAYGIDKAHFIGASMGGVVVQHIALQHPDRALTITPIMTTPDASSLLGQINGDGTTDALPGATEAVIEALMSGLTVDQTDEAAVIELGIRMDKVVAGDAFPFDEEWTRELAVAEMKRASNYASRNNHAVIVANTPRWRERLAGITTPTLVIHGTADPILPFEHGQALAADIPNAKFLPLEGVGHENPRGSWPIVVPAILEHTA